MKVAFVTSEMFPFSKTGGLADIAYFLPKGLAKLNTDMTVFTPYYRTARIDFNLLSFLGKKTIRMGGIETDVNYFTYDFEGVKVIFVQNMHYFERDRLYGYNDDAERFTCFSYAVLEGLELLDHMPDLLHINDWQTGMIPYLYEKHYKGKFTYSKLRITMTIHNMEYQGNFDTYVARFFNHDFDYEYIHFDRVNFLKTGILKSDKINTVSPSYRNEILSLDYGFSLDGILNYRKNDLVGILNGIDDETFNPEKDKFIENYNFSNYKAGKLAAKKKVYDAFHLDKTYEKTLVIYIGRYANQKGLWMIQNSLEDLIHHSDAQFFFLGSGDPNYENFFKVMTEKYPGRVGNYIGFNERLAHELYAASDIFLMPSEFEPCGLGQMISMKYGSLPVVRETGGLKDTVLPYNQYTGEGTGFSFKNLSMIDFKDKVFEAIMLKKNNPKIWDSLVRQAMEKDYSMEKMAKAYLEFYKTIIGG
ncbi:glycogen synthase [Acholeplasma equirhinis]|uniref:glycogen synthase n=1 Tax=Acholeplasma equirhinis TaxID=555393 RepID=UPI00197AC21D|nr:glycogen synthase [Acholeplasma equirhinis]MBN3490358.1 glycogen synthase [Acholeplasma equirhinis]